MQLCAPTDSRWTGFTCEVRYLCRVISLIVSSLGHPITTSLSFTKQSTDATNTMITVCWDLQLKIGEEEHLDSVPILLLWCLNYSTSYTTWCNCFISFLGGTWEAIYFTDLFHTVLIMSGGCTLRIHFGNRSHMCWHASLHRCKPESTFSTKPNIRSPFSEALVKVKPHHWLQWQLPKPYITLKSLPVLQNVT